MRTAHRAALTHTPATDGSTESTGGASASTSSLSLERPPALDGERALAVQAAAQRAAGPGSEVGLSAASPLERDAVAGAADLDLMVQPETAATTGGPISKPVPPSLRTCRSRLRRGPSTPT